MASSRYFAGSCILQTTQARTPGSDSKMPSSWGPRNRHDGQGGFNPTVLGGPGVYWNWYPAALPKWLSFFPSLLHWAQDASVVWRFPHYLPAPGLLSPLTCLSQKTLLHLLLHLASVSWRTWNSAIFLSINFVMIFYCVTYELSQCYSNVGAYFQSPFHEKLQTCSSNFPITTEPKTKENQGYKSLSSTQEQTYLPARANTCWTYLRVHFNPYPI